MVLEDRILFLTWPQTWKNPLPAGLSREAQSLEAVQQCIVSPSLEALVLVVTGFDFWRCWFLAGVLVHERTADGAERQTQCLRSGAASILAVAWPQQCDQIGVELDRRQDRPQTCSPAHAVRNSARNSAKTLECK